MPVIDRVVVLQTRIGAFPGSLGDLAEQLPGIHLLDDLARHPGAQSELGAIGHGLHELVTDANRVVGVLVLHRGDVLAAEIHVESGIAQRTDLVLLARLGLDELLDVGVIDVQHNHLRGAAGGATRLDGARRCVRTAHEADRTGRSATGRAQQFLGGADPREVEAGAGPALEDHALFAVPVQDRFHGVVDRQDEAGADLLRRRGADIEPDRGVEAEVLVQQQPGELLTKDLGIVIGREVAGFLAGLLILADHAVDQRLEAGFALRGAERAAEVLGRDDRGCVEAP